MFCFDCTLTHRTHHFFFLCYYPTAIDLRHNKSVIFLCCVYLPLCLTNRLPTRANCWCPIGWYIRNNDRKVSRGIDIGILDLYLPSCQHAKVMGKRLLNITADRDIRALRKIVASKRKITATKVTAELIIHLENAVSRKILHRELHKQNINGKATHSPTFPSLHLRHNLFPNPSVALPTSQLILQPFRCFTYVTVHSLALLSLLLRHKLFT